MSACWDPGSKQSLLLTDELLGEGTPLVNMTAVARRIKQTFGRETMIYANFDARPFTVGVNGSVCAASERCPAAPLPQSCCLTRGVPSEIDVVSVRATCCPFDSYARSGRL